MAIKTAERRKMIAYEKKLELDYIEMLDQQERARAARLDAMARRMENKGEMFLKNTEEARRKEREDDRRRLAQQEEKRAELEAQAAARDRARQQRNRDQVKELNSQMKFKRDQEALRQRELRDFAIAQNKDMAVLLRQDAKKKTSVRSRNIAHKGDLVRMMASDKRKKTRYKEADMDPLQLEINRGMLKKAYRKKVGRSDKELARKYREHVHKTQGSTIIRGPC
jgi:hypothetical protein